MASLKQCRSRISHLCLRVLAIALAAPIVAAQLAGAQAYTYTVLHMFHGDDGADPEANLLQDSSGNFYGTTASGGTAGQGVVFKLDTNGAETVLHSFMGRPTDGSEPVAGLIQDAAGNLYGTTQFGGRYFCVLDGSCGTVFELDTAGRETVLYSFNLGPDGAIPTGGLVIDASGTLYGTTGWGGNVNSCQRPYGCGVVFKLDSTRRETVLHSFGGAGGAGPTAGLIRDAAGNLCGTAQYDGPDNHGMVFRLSTAGRFTALHKFTREGDGANSEAPLIRDMAGNLYGTTFNGGGGTGCGGDGCGTVFKLDATRKETVLYRFNATGASHPAAGLIRDAEGNLYGTAAWGGGTGCHAYRGCGAVFELKKNGELIVLHSFKGRSDGGLPYGSLIQDEKGSLYGTASVGGDLRCAIGNGHGCGVVFKLTPRR